MPENKKNLARDFIGQPLAVGDEVAYMGIGGRTMGRGTVANVTSKMLAIQPVHGGELVRQFHGQVININLNLKTEV